MPQDILLNNDMTPQIKEGDFVIGESTVQETQLILQTNQGNLKHAPLLGANLMEFVKSNASRIKVEARIAQTLKMDGKDYKQLKYLIKLP